MRSRRFPAPWQVEQMPCGYKMLDGAIQNDGLSMGESVR